MEINHDTIRLSLFTTIMILLTIIVCYFFNRKPEENTMEKLKVIEINDVKNPNVILKDEICYLYMNEVANNIKVIGKLVAQDDSTVDNIVIIEGGMLTVNYNSVCKNIVLYPQTSMLIELKSRSTYYEFKNDTKFIIIVSELTNEMKDKYVDKGMIEIPCTIQAKFEQ